MCMQSSWAAVSPFSGGRQSMWQHAGLHQVHGAACLQISFIQHCAMPSLVLFNWHLLPWKTLLPVDVVVIKVTVIR